MLLLLIFSLLAVSPTTAAAATAIIGVTYNPAPSLPPPDRVAALLQSLHVPAVRIPQPNPTVIRAFSYTNISLHLTVPNPLLPSFATNRTFALLWLYTHVVPFHPRARISSISVGTDFLSTTSLSDPSHLLPAIRNVHLSLRDLGIRTISVSTTFSFVSIITTSFPPSSAEFQPVVNDLIIKPLLDFLYDTNSSFLVNLQPYNVLRLSPEIPIGYALFQEHAYNFRDDVITGVRYRNLFDMMVDAVVAAMAVSGHENIPLVVTETGWPSSNSGGTDNDAETSEVYAEMYLKGLIEHLRSGYGTPLRKEGVAESYIYELFDSNSSREASGLAGQDWGILHANNMSLKYKINFASSSAWRIGLRNGGGLAVGLFCVVSLLLV